jgi:hypothetical protein
MHTASVFNWEDLLDAVKNLSPNAAPLAGGIQSCLCSFPEYRSFELRKDSDHLQHHSPWSSRRINRFRQAPESGLGLFDPFHDHQDVPERARKSVKTPDNQDVVLPELIQ